MPVTLKARCKDVALAPLHEFVSIEATNATASCGLHRLLVHDNHRGTRRPAGLSVCLLIDGSFQAGPYTGVLPSPEIVIHGPPVGKLPRKKTPLAAGAQQIENRVDHSTKIGGARPSAELGCRRKWGEEGQCCIAHVRRILMFWHSPALRNHTDSLRNGPELFKHPLTCLPSFPQTFPSPFVSPANAPFCDFCKGLFGAYNPEKWIAKE